MTRAKNRAIASGVVWMECSTNNKLLERLLVRLWSFCTYVRDRCRPSKPRNAVFSGGRLISCSIRMGVERDNIAQVQLIIDIGYRVEQW